jgi:D-galactarolactone cycloisomerase
LSLLAEPHWGHPTDTPLLEIDQGENPWRDGLAIDPPTIKDGYIEVPKKPGLGIEVNEDVVRKYAVT